MPRLNINYQNIVMYKIVCNDLNIKDIYVGSTTDFTRRKREHRSRCNTNSLIKIYTIINANSGWTNWTMIEIEKYPCSDGNEARARERYWYELLQPTMNMIKPIFTSNDLKEKKKEYRTDNKEYLNAYSKEYRTDNKEYFNAYNKEYRTNNKEKNSIYMKEYKIKNKEKISAYKKQYYLNNKEKINLISN